ncbi:smalltalk protein [Segatella copri]
MMNDYFPINLIVPMKKETLKKIINLIITVLTAIASAVCVQSCRG